MKEISDQYIIGKNEPVSQRFIWIL